jgi:hypothetical protein
MADVKAFRNVASEESATRTPTNPIFRNPVISEMHSRTIVLCTVTRTYMREAYTKYPAIQNESHLATRRHKMVLKMVGNT